MGWVGGLVYGSISAVVGYFIIAHVAMDAYRMGQVSKSWPSTQGVVIHAGVASSGPSGGKVSYSEDVQFTYRVDGRNYKSSRIDVEPGPGATYSSDPSNARTMVNRYPTGKSVAVYYNPAKPSLGVLQPGVTAMTWRIIGIGSVFIFIGALIALSGMIRTLFGFGLLGVLTFAWMRKHD